jgi:hypothetical protein
MFIGQGSSVVGVCVVYGLSSLVHPFNCLYKPLIEEKKRETRGENRRRRRRRTRRGDSLRQYI